MLPPVIDLLVLSDLHLSEGRSPDSKTVSLNEDFFFDEEFARFLDFHVHHFPDQSTARRWNLIINGDFLDFLQVVSPISEDSDRDFLEYLGIETAAEAMRLLRFDREHPEYGLGSGPRETVYKLWKIMTGHWLFFEALAKFVQEGNLVTIGRGNHDVEFIYPEVRQQFVPKLRRIYANKLARERDSDHVAKLQRFDAACDDGAVRFIDWFYYEPGLLWAEHGNQYDEVNSFRYWLAPYLPQSTRVEAGREDEIDLPWGSFFVRYLFNKIEVMEPWADNIKPQSRFIRWFVTTHPTMALGFLFGDGRYMVKKMARAWREVPDGAYSERAAEHRRRLEELAAKASIPLGTLLEMDALGFRSPNILEEPYGSWKIWRQLTLAWPLSLAVTLLLLIAGAIGLLWIIVHLLDPLLPDLVRSAAWGGWQLPSYLLKIIDGIRWSSLIIFVFLIGLYLDSLLSREEPEQISCLADRANQIHEKLQVRYVTMGHTHQTDLQTLGKGGSGKEYFNTGTWTKVFGDEKDRLLHAESELVFLRVVHSDGGAQAKLMKWEDGPGEPRLVMLFEGEKR